MNTTTSLNALSSTNEFTARHIGPSEQDKKAMLRELGFTNSDELISKIVPKSILNKEIMNVGTGISEYEILADLKKNKQELRLNIEQTNNLMLKSRLQSNCSMA